MEHYFVDLYTKEYPADETIIEFTAENADERLKSVCEKALYDKYGKDVPEFIIERYNFEIENTNNILRLKLLDYLGIKPVIDKCIECGNTHNIVTISSYLGGYVCRDCYRNEKIVSPKTISLIK